MLTKLKPGQNPREVFGNHRERGPKRFGFGLADAAKATGLSVRQVQRAIASGELIPGDLVSLAWWVTGKHLTHHARKA